MKITTDRLILREMTASDLDALHRVLGDPDIMLHYPAPFTREKTEAWIQRNRERCQSLGFGLWAVCLKETGEVIGDCGLTMQQIGGDLLPEIGYHIRRDQQRKGYAKEAAIAVRDWAFEHTPFDAVYSYMKHTNEPSRSTAIAYGCRQVDEYPDEVNGITQVFAISRETWEALRSRE